METSNARFTLTRAEFLKGTRYITFRRRGMLRLILIGAFILTCGVFLLSLNYLAFGWIYTVIGVLTLLLPLAVVQLTSRRWKEDPSVHVERVYRISDERLEVSTPLITASNEWALFSELVEAEEFFVLRTKGSRGSILIPKRGFVTRADEEAFRRIACRHITKLPEGYKASGVASATES